MQATFVMTNINKRPAEGTVIGLTIWNKKANIKQKTIEDHQTQQRLRNKRKR